MRRLKTQRMSVLTRLHKFPLICHDNYFFDKRGPAGFEKKTKSKDNVYALVLVDIDAVLHTKSILAAHSYMKKKLMELLI